MTTLQITLPWPPKELNPNARQHWTKLARAKKAYRAACAWQAKAQGARRMDVDCLHMTITFFLPDRRHRDMDNMLASIKAGLDGLADVLCVNDRTWALTLVKSDQLGGMVKLEVANG